MWWLVVLATMAVDSTNAISCYECDSSNNFSCTEFWDPTLPVTSQYYSNCSHVFEARYCVKMTGVFDGKLGTKRFCSSKDWGNYCEYIERPGGKGLGLIGQVFLLLFSKIKLRLKNFKADLLHFYISNQIRSLEFLRLLFT